MPLFPTPPAADPLYIFGRHSPIDLTFMRLLLQNLLSAQPGYTGASPERQAGVRRATMHALAEYRPENAVEATLAGQLVATHARIMACYRRAALPDAEEAAANRHGAQAASLLRCSNATLRALQRQQAIRRKEADQPNERAGYWFRDVSVPAPDSLPPSPGLTPGSDPADAPAPKPPPPGKTGAPALEPKDHMQREPAAATAPSGPPGVAAARRIDPMPRESRAAASPGDESPQRFNPMSSENGIPAGPRHDASPGSARAPAPDPADPVQSDVRVRAGASDATPRRINPMPSEKHDLPDRMMTGDAMMRFASRRLDPNQSVEAAWAQAVAEAAAEEAEAARP